MERLTERTSSGAANLAYPAACYFNDGTRDGIATSAYRQKAINRLAAYEDTGLEPEEIKTAFNEGALLKLTAQYLSTTPDRLREWAKADKDGRLVVLPCKVGDTVYAIRSGCEICPFALAPCESEATEFCGKDVVRDLPFAIRWLEDIGKRYFLTREEAEAALAGERKDGEG